MPSEALKDLTIDAEVDDLIIKCLSKSPKKTEYYIDYKFDNGNGRFITCRAMVYHEQCMTRVYVESIGNYAHHRVKIDGYEKNWVCAWVDSGLSKLERAYYLIGSQLNDEHKEIYEAMQEYVHV